MKSRLFFIFLIAAIFSVGAWYVLSGQKKELIDQAVPSAVSETAGTTSIPVIIGKQKSGTRPVRNAAPIDAIIDSPADEIAVNPPRGGQQKKKPIISPEDYLFLEPEKPSPPRYVTLAVGNKELRVEHAYDLRKQIKGLSGRKSIDENSGLLYAFADQGQYHFWMRGMLFAIDILWIGSDGRVVDVKENISPDTFPEKFTSREPAHYVLEASAGFAKRNSISIGTRVDFSKFSRQ